MELSNNTLIIGRGEIGNSLYSILGSHYPTWCEDINPELKIMDNVPDEIDFLHICIRYSEYFQKTVVDYLDKFNPTFINICTTVPPGTTESIYKKACHSTTRGLHPHLQEGLRKITKHIGGPLSVANEFKEYFENAGIPCMVHNQAKTTELLHILNNCHYGVNLMFADEAAKLCRKFGVDYYDYMKYCETNNDGYIALGNKTKVRPILTPPNGRIGGHCVTSSADLIADRDELPLIIQLANYISE